jgi:prepilin-type processing-associated H-X9-DG protein
MTRMTNRRYRRGFTVADLVVGACCLLVAGSLLVSLTGATRDLSQAQVCANNLRQMYTGLTAYVNQYNCYPPHNPYPQYMASRTVNGLFAGGFDPSIGWIMTHGLGLVPPATDTATGHFIWYGTPFADLPDVCKCPAMSPALLDPTNPELDAGSLETNLYQYALSYMTSGTCRAATPAIRPGSPGLTSLGGRNPPIPDPRNADISAHPADNAQNGVPYVWVEQHDKAAAPDDPRSSGVQYNCWIQAINPSEVQTPGRTFYLADSRDYRPSPGSWPGAGKNSGWGAGYGNTIFVSARHYGWSNVLYLDGAVSRDGQRHYAMWNMDYDPATGQARSSQWRVATFDSGIKLANIQTQMLIMPVFMVKGWEAFFDANGLKAR